MQLMLNNKIIILVFCKYLFVMNFNKSNHIQKYLVHLKGHQKAHRKNTKITENTVKQFDKSWKHKKKGKKSSMLYIK